GPVMAKASRSGGMAPSTPRHSEGFAMPTTVVSGSSAAAQAAKDGPGTMMRRPGAGGTAVPVVALSVASCRRSGGRSAAPAFDDDEAAWGGWPRSTDGGVLGRELQQLTVEVGGNWH